MDLQELKVLVDYAIDDCQRIIQKDPKTILSEGDFERLLSDCISKRIGYNPGILQPDEYAVHSQITHYDNESDIYEKNNSYFNKFGNRFVSL